MNREVQILQGLSNPRTAHQFEAIGKATLSESSKSLKNGMSMLELDRNGR